MFSKFIKIVIIITVSFIIAVLGYVAGSYAKHYLDIRKADKAVDNFQNALEQPYKDDIYGGKTPEETWGMFLDALKRGDIELASKYYAVGRAAAGNVPVDEIYKKKESGELDEWIKELEALEKDEQQ